GGFGERIHGWAPAVAGRARATRLAAILSVALLCRSSLACPAAADAIERAVAGVVAAGHRTADVAPAGTPGVGCLAMGRLVRERAWRVSARRRGRASRTTGASRARAG